MNVKKIDKEFQLTDSSVNCYGFRLLTQGYQLAEYLKNPIGYFMHDRDCGVLVRWEDLRVDGDKVFGKPVINMSNERAQQTIDEIENGFLNAASVGHLVILEFSDDPALKLAGQEGPTVTKWFNRECSLVDIPGNFNSLKLFDADDNEIKLADFTTSKNFTTDHNKKMKTLLLTALQLSAMNLKAESTDLEITNAFNDLVAKASKADSLELELKNLKDSQNKADVESQLSAALTEKRITVKAADKLKVDYAQNPKGLKDLLSTIPVYTPITSSLEANADSKIKDLMSKSWDELMSSGELEDLKAKSPEGYKEVFKKKFGVDPQS